MPSVPLPPVRVIATAVCPAAIFSHTHMPEAQTPDALSNIRLEKLPATPPRVIVAPVGLVVAPRKAMETTRQLVAVVLAPRVTVTDAPEAWVLLADWTRVIAMGHQASVWVIVPLDMLTVLPLTIDNVDRFRSAPEVPTLPIATTVVPSAFSNAK